jgi:cation diffusion facilitator CzcD-associated flavoprotein CzcO
VHDAVVIGAGVAGLYQLYQLCELGVDVIGLDQNADVGGTWFNNRYPGCRFDSESYTYGYSFSADLLDEWDWSEHFAAQPETLRYLSHVADRFDLRRSIEFGCSVETMTFDDTTATWSLGLADGRTMDTRFVVAAVGPLSAPTLPRYPGIDRFEGSSFHTFDWPHEPVDLRGKRVAVVGTGASGVQVIGAIAADVEQLTVYQRRPNWCAPLHNRPISPAEMDEIRAGYERLFSRLAETPGGFIHAPDPRVFADTSAQERLAFWERLYASPGFEKWIGNFREVLTDEAANAEFSAFVADKIRHRVHDPAVADKLIPTDHGFGVQRVPLESGYYEAFNLPHVELVDLEETPIVEVTPAGIRTSDGDREFDVIVWATGFDAITGPFDRMTIRGSGGRYLRDAWDGDPVTYLGIAVHGFPNLFMVTGPQGACATNNFPPTIEIGVRFISGLLRYAVARGHRCVEARADAQAAWGDEVARFYERLLLRNAKSWFTGYNENIPGRDRKRHVMYNGGLPRFRENLAAVAADDYPTFEFRH